MSQNRRPLSIVLISAAAALVTFVACMYHNLLVFDSRVILIFDSAHYIVTAEHFVLFITALTRLDVPAALAAICSPSAITDLLIDGPITPFLAALAFCLSGNHANSNHWQAIAVLLSLTSGASAFFVTTITSTMTRNKLSCFAAGLLFGLSPSTILASNRFYTEPFAAVFIAAELFLTLCVMSTRNSIQRKILVFSLGLTASFGFYLKPALIMIWLAPMVCLLCFLLKQHRLRKAFKVLLPGTIAFLLLPTIWTVFIFENTGAIKIVPERMPAHNLAKGNDYRSDSFGAVPELPSAKALEKIDKPLKILRTAWLSNPLELAWLYARKPIKLVMTPWNDFLQKPYGWSYDLQNFVYTSTMYFALTAILLWLINFKRNNKFHENLFFGTLVTIFFLSTATYIPFEGISRYGYPSFPLACSLAVIGISNAFSDTHKKVATSFWAFLILLAAWYSTQSTNLLCYSDLTLADAITHKVVLNCFVFIAICIASICLVRRADKLKGGLSSFRKISVCILALTGFVITAAGSAYYPDYQDFKIQLNPKQCFSREFSLAPKKNDSFILVADVDKPEDCIFSINRKCLTEYVPLLALNRNDYHCIELQRRFAEALDTPLQSFRTWRAWPVNAELLKGKAAITCTTVANSNAAIWCDRSDSTAGDTRLPHWYYFSAGRLANFPKNLDGRLPNMISDQSYFQLNRLTADGQQTIKTNGKPRIFLLQLSGAQPQPNIHIPPFTIQLQSDSFDKVLRLDANNIAIDRYRLKATSSLGTSFSLPKLIMSRPLARITISGKIKSNRRAAKGSVLFTLENSNNHHFFVIPDTPPYIEASNEPSNFSFTSYVNLSGLPDRYDCASLSVFPGRWPQITQYGVDNFSKQIEFSNLQVTIEEMTLPELTETHQSLSKYL